MVCPKKRAQVVLEAFGTPDVRQIDGLGGADPLTGKVAHIGAPTVPGTDIDYTFGYVGIANPVIDYTATAVTLSSGRSLRPVMWPHQTRRAHNQGPVRERAVRMRVLAYLNAVRIEHFHHLLEQANEEGDLRLVGATCRCPRKVVFHFFLNFVLLNLNR